MHYNECIGYKYVKIDCQTTFLKKFNMIKCNKNFQQFHKIPHRYYRVQIPKLLPYIIRQVFVSNLEINFYRQGATRTSILFILYPITFSFYYSEFEKQVQLSKCKFEVFQKCKNHNLKFKLLKQLLIKFAILPFIFCIVILFD